MIKQNMGRLDRIARFIAGVALTPLGLFPLGAWQGQVIGMAAVGVALLLLTTSLTGVCPGYIPFGVATLRGEPKAADRQAEARAR